MEIIIILVVILVVFYFFNTTNKKEGFDFWSDLNSTIGSISGNSGNRQISINCDMADMNTCDWNPNYIINCPTECAKINQCRRWAENNECNINPDYMKKLSLKEGGCKEVCDQREAAIKAIRENSPFGNLMKFN